MKLKRSELVNTIRTPLKFHWSALLLLLLSLPFFIYLIVEHFKLEWWQGTLMGVWYYIILFGSVLIHEYFHIWEARSREITVLDIKLIAWGGAARVDGRALALDRRATLWVSLAGPLGSFILMAIGFLLSFLNFNIFVPIFAVNALMLVFNLLPLFPMDGGRVLYAILCKFFVMPKAHRIAAYVSYVLCVVLAIVSLAFQEWWLVFIFVVLIYLGYKERKAIVGLFKQLGMI